MTETAGSVCGRDVSVLKGVGPAKREALGKLGIETVVSMMSSLRMSYTKSLFRGYAAS